MHSINLSGDSDVSTVILREIEENTQHDLEYEESVHDFAKSNSIVAREHNITMKKQIIFTLSIYQRYKYIISYS